MHALQIFIMNTENIQDLMPSEECMTWFRHGSDMVMVTVPVTFSTNTVDIVSSLALQYTTYLLNHGRANWTRIEMLCTLED